MLASQLHTLAALIREQPDRPLADLQSVLSASETPKHPQAENHRGDSDHEKRSGTRHFPVIDTSDLDFTGGAHPKTRLTRGALRQTLHARSSLAPGTDPKTGSRFAQPQSASICPSPSLQGGPVHQMPIRLGAARVNPTTWRIRDSRA